MVTAALLIVNFLSDTTANACKEYGAPTRRQCTGDYIGLTRDEAVAKAKENKLFPQIVRIDGEAQGVLDIGGQSIFLEIKDGKVVRGSFDFYTENGGQ